VTQYENDMSDVPGLPALSPSLSPSHAVGVPRTAGAAELSVRDVFFADEGGRPLREVLAGRNASLNVQYDARRRVVDLHFSVLIRNLSRGSELVLNLSSGRDNQPLAIESGEGYLELKLTPVVLGPGLYVAKIVLADASFYIFDAMEEYRFVVRAETGMNECVLFQPREWCVRPVTGAIAGWSAGTEGSDSVG
jgi:lipopolysaccharide transport system ATP-binding protein